MRSMSNGRVQIDLVNSTTDVAEVTKAGAELGYTVIVRPSRDDTGIHIELHREEPAFLISELAKLAIIEAIARDATVDGILDDVRRQVKRLDFLSDRVPSDGLGISETLP